VSTIVPIVDVGTVKAAGWKGLDVGSEAEIDFAIFAATAEIEQRIKPRKIAKATYTLDPYSGSKTRGRYRELLFLDQRPIVTLTAVKENGVTLVAGSGYDAAGAFDVLVDYADGILIRKAGTNGQIYADSPPNRVERAWASGLQNIEVSMDAGFNDPLTECPDLVEVCIKLAKLHFHGPRRAGQAGTQGANRSTTFIHSLSKAELLVIDTYAGHGRPRCK
jgi:hypothetical protein